MRTMWLAIVLAGCVGGTGTTKDGNSGDDTSGTSDGGDVDKSDPHAGLAAKSGCDGHNDSDGNFVPIAGATSFFVGRFALSGEDVSGEEWWVLFANDTWKSTAGAADCQIGWSVTGKKTDPTGCGSCSYNLAIHATMDMPETDCIKDLVDSTKADPTENENDVTYSVAVDGSGNSTFYFADSGNTLGKGSATDTRVDYTTDSSCKFF